MNPKIIGVFLLVIVAVVAIYFGTQNDDSTTNPESAPSSKIEQQAPEPPKSPPSPETEVTTKSFVEVSQIVPAMSGMTKETRGIVTVFNEGKGNIFFTLKDANGSATVKGIMFAKTNNDGPERKAMLLKSRDNNSVVWLKGEIDVYKGELEIKVWQVYEK